jgi:hypothetical protein
MIPIKIVKDDLIISIEALDQINTPFYFRLADKEIFIDKDSKPFYFTRRRMRVSRGEVTQRYVHRYCVGYEKDNLKIKYWVFPDGRFDILAEEPSEG